MKPSTANLIKAIGFIVFGIIIGGLGIAISDADDAPGAMLIGVVLMVVSVVLGVRTARRKTRD